jgi:hypothetical protein
MNTHDLDVRANNKHAALQAELRTTIDYISEYELEILHEGFLSQAEQMEHARLIRKATLLKVKSEFEKDNSTKHKNFNYEHITGNDAMHGENLISLTLEYQAACADNDTEKMAELQEKMANKLLANMMTGEARDEVIEAARDIAEIHHDNDFEYRSNALPMRCDPQYNDFSI